jgi:hypothetical protein
MTTAAARGNRAASLRNGMVFAIPKNEFQARKRN